MSRVMITIPDEFLAEIDSAATAQHRSRSELFREAMRQYLKEYANAIDLFRSGSGRYH